MNGVGIQFWQEHTRRYGGKQYTYKCRLNDLKIGDLVVVDARRELKVVMVTSLDAEMNDERITYKEILCKLPEMIN